MILCVTLNPCLDKTLTVPSWRPGDLVRGRAVREVVGGKGNNVARALLRLGRKPRPVTFLGGPVGIHCEALLRTDDGLEPLVVRTEAPTRVILTVRTEASAEQTAFFDPDPAITPAEADALAAPGRAGLQVGEVEALTLSGSSPAPATHGLYSDLIALAQRAERTGLPRHLRPGARCDLGLLADRRSSSTAGKRPPISRSRRLPTTDVAGLLRDWHRHGVACGVVTDGPNPVSILLRGRRYRAIPPAIKAVNPIGSGDCACWPGWLTAG